MISTTYENLVEDVKPGDRLLLDDGSIELECTATGTDRLICTVVCGGIELRVPKDWRVNIQTTTLLGGTENKHRQPSDADAKGQLTITGTVVCGGIEVKD